jgi:hypothetical protein
MLILEVAAFLQVVFADDRYVAVRLLLIISVHYFRVHCGSEAKPGAPNGLIRRGLWESNSGSLPITPDTFRIAHR